MPGVINEEHLKSATYKAIMLARGKGYEFYSPCNSDHYLQPSFWQAIGKSLGKESECIDYHEPKKCGCGSTHSSSKPWWIVQQYRFIDHLAEGKDAESFFNNLLNNK